MVLLSVTALGITDKKPDKDFNAGNELVQTEDQLPSTQLYFPLGSYNCSKSARYVTQ